MQIFIGNICKSIDSHQLRERLEKFGEVESLKIEDEMAYAVMPHDKEAEVAILQLDKSDLEGFRLSVHTARYGSTDRRKSGRIGGRRSKDHKNYTRMFSRKDLLI